jgi:hypothetical protein
MVNNALVSLLEDTTDKAASVAMGLKLSFLVGIIQVDVAPVTYEPIACAYQGAKPCFSRVVVAPQAVLGLFKVGAIVNYVSYPVMTAFNTAGKDPNHRQYSEAGLVPRDQSILSTR